MQLRMLARRSLSASMTVVGDIAQATGPWAPSSWAQVVEHLPTRRGWRLSELTVNYRTPSEIMDVAGRLLEAATPGARPPVSVRDAGVAPEVVAVTGDGAFPASLLPGAVAEVVTASLAGRRAGGGSVGVIAAPSLLRPLGDALRQAGVRFGRAGADALEEAVSLLSVTEAKGLEFDEVVVAEPARVVGESDHGLRALYVAVTRATQRLVVVHSEGLPAELRVLGTARGAG